MTHSLELGVLVVKRFHEALGSLGRGPESLDLVFYALLLLGFREQRVFVHSFLDHHLPHPLVLVGRLLLEEVHDLLPGPVAQRLAAPQPDQPGSVEMGEPLQQQPHVRRFHSSTTCPLNLLHVHKFLLAALHQVLHQDDALLLGLADEAPGQVVLLVVAVGEVDPGHHCGQRRCLVLRHQLTQLGERHAEPECLAVEDEQAEPDVSPGRPGLER